MANNPAAVIDQLIEASFFKYDRNKDGYLDRDEVRQLLTDAFAHDVTGAKDPTESQNKADAIVNDFMESLAGKGQRVTKDKLVAAIKPLIVEIFEND